MELSSAQLYIASGQSPLLALYVSRLPKIPVCGETVATLASKLGWMRSFCLKNPRMAIFFLFAMTLVQCCKSPTSLAIRS
ncbi:hypothetical protein ACNKHK_15715 [Shigella flexneri]